MPTQQFNPISLLFLITTLSAVRVVDSFQLSKLYLHFPIVQKIGRGKALLHAAPDGMKWFVKTEKFCKPYPQVKPHLEAHREWVSSLRDSKNSAQQVIASGYRVDENDKPGGGGLMIFAAKDYSAAEELVMNDPLIENECVDWRLNRWIPETGDITLD